MQTHTRIVFLVAVTMCSACSSVPPPRAIPPEQVLRQENAEGLELAARFERTLKFRRDSTVQEYLSRMAETLSASNPELKLSHAGVMIIRDEDDKWRNFSLPGNRIYLSRGFVKSIEFENELAAAIAMELGHIAKHQALDRLRKLEGLAGGPEYANRDGSPSSHLADERHSIDFTGPAGVFDYSDDAIGDAAEVAVDLLYKAGYDPRGLVTIWNRYNDDPVHSPYDSGTVEKTVETIRRAIALYLPLRNPIVRSQAFLAIQRRIRKL